MFGVPTSQYMALTAELDYAVSEFAYDWYNQVRLHSYNGYLTPFEKRAECTIKQWYYKSVNHYSVCMYNVRPELC